MLKSEILHKKISMYFTHIETYIKYENKEGSFDINKYCENFFRDLLNIIYKTELVNLNELEMNFPAVDLGDDEDGVCYQVTSDKTRSKVLRTIDKFIERKLYNTFDELYILILGAKSNYKKFEPYNEIDFDKDRNIIDLIDLAKHIKTLPNKRAEKIVNYIENNMNTNTGEPSFYESIIENEAIYPKSMNKYFEYHDLISEDQMYARSAYFDFIDALKELDIDSRTVIFAAYKKAYSNMRRNYELLFNINELYTYLGIDRQRLYEKLDILYKRKMLDPAEESGDEFDRLSIYFNDIEMFYDLKCYCDHFKIKYEKPLLQLDFSILD